MNVCAYDAVDEERGEVRDFTYVVAQVTSDVDEQLCVYWPMTHVSIVHQARDRCHVMCDVTMTSCSAFTRHDRSRDVIA